MTVNEVAEELRTSTEVVIQALRTGQLAGFLVGSEWRTTEEAVQAMIYGATVTIDQDTDESGSEENRSEEASQMTEFETGWVRVSENLEHYWPTESEPEKYDCGWRRGFQVNGKEITLFIPFGYRLAADLNRRRAIVFLGEPSAPKYPIVEFTGANNFDESKLMASVIKPTGQKQLRANEPIPASYQHLPTGIYNQIVSGKYASGSRCVVARDDQLAIMATHALLRIQQKNLV